MENLFLTETLFSKRELLEIEVSNIIEHLLAGWDDYIIWKSCWASEFREIVSAWIKWELWEKYRLLKSYKNQELIKEFVNLILNF